MRAVRLGALGDGGGRERNPDRSRDVTEHGKQRGGVAVELPWYRNKSDGGERNKQEPQPERLGATKEHQCFEINIRRQGSRPEERHRQTGETKGDDPARLHDGHQFQHQRDGQDNQHRAGREHHPGPGGGVAQILLRQLRDHHRTAVQNHRHAAHQQTSDGKVFVLHAAQIHHRFFGVKEPVNRADDANKRQYREGTDKVRVEPVIVFAAIEHHLQTAKPEGDQANPRPVDRQFLFGFTLPRRIFQ
ncbi:hypothetical protein D3C86_1484910 [compost metagenome]